MSENITKTQAFKLKGRLYTFTVLQIQSSDKDIFAQQFADTVAKAPKLFDNTPIVFDLSQLHDEEYDLQGFIQLAREFGTIPVAVQSPSPFYESVAKCNGLAVLNASSTQDKPIIEQPVDSQPQAHVKSKLVTVPVRSGQKVIAKQSDLIVTSSVSHGAELLADGSIHVYGALRGRALAGLSGDLDARIFCQSLEAELVSIAGYYMLSDAIAPVNGPCQIFLKDEHLVIEPV